ncbi:lipopolysaccharide biosynthesis protein [Paradesertivirga mongoliensis]|uniref:Lipopolysaccharide biosynthesis protein n=1 Tax=Paradesertivirga mongoliensis TaxID=2100740 RepID=A0ABW4ZID5_9SPHI|nr:polysaccharide biosynthesis C-terminal domain-containing protein [Pedobacter mongoliensis]
MSVLKKLASQTAVYGLSSILGRFLNYLLVGFHTRVLTDVADFGVVGEIYAYVTFLNIIYLYGLETSYFRFSSKDKPLAHTYYSSSFTSILISSALLSGALIVFSGYINELLITDPSAAAYYRQDYVIWFALILAFDAITAIPFARLRQENRPLAFASIKIFNILVNVFLNIFWLWFCPWWLEANPDSVINYVYSPSNKVAYIFLANLIASGATILLLYKQIKDIRLRVNWNAFKPMLAYGFPLLFAGLAGMMNETFGRTMLKYLLPGSAEQNLAQLGIYNAAYKLSIFMTLAVQAFRMAAEPFFFSLHKEQDSKKIYAEVMEYFVIVCAAIFLAVSLNLNIAGLYLGEQYRSGLFVVPTLLLANLFLGVYYNLSIWYKLTDKTMYSIYFTVFGAIITVVLNIIWIPTFGYEGSSWATLLCYFFLALTCYFIGQKYFKVPYRVWRILSYLAFMLLIYGLGRYIETQLLHGKPVVSALFNNTLLIIFILTAWLVEKKNLNRDE